MKSPAKPLFIPLNSGPYEDFESGLKRFEMRLHGPRWNVRNCYPGRAVILSKGYGTKSRISGRVSSFQVTYASSLPSKERDDFLACYGEEKRHHEIALIGIEVERAA